MPFFKIICLANSRKLLGRCVAGLRTDGRGWIRPVSKSADGALYLPDYTLEDGSEAKVLDVLEIEVIQARLQPHQPENWLLGDRRWKLMERPASDKHQRSFDSYIVPGPNLFGNKSDRIPVGVLNVKPAKASLALAIPDNMEWIVTRNIKGKPQVRASFDLGGASYDLGVTDPIVERYLRSFRVGRYSLKSLGLKNTDRLLLTISLGEPFQGDCYKLVSSILLFKDGKWCYLIKE